VIENCGAALLPFPAVSLAPPAGTSTVTPPSTDGVIVAVYDAPLPLKLTTVAFATVRSLDVNPVTASLKVIVIGIGDVFVGLLAELDTDTVGAVVSMTMFFNVAKEFGLANPGRVNVAGIFELLIIVPPFRTSEFVAT
jgi:hypothetical protein